MLVLKLLMCWALLSIPVSFLFIAIKKRWVK